ncbi:hypothetical protein ACHAW5_001407 [Stephanodiscus triporus]|uniref:DUF2723 domain-containing protein n=1 Tax=Stephanodiscus triporus TaxID=2934178 RepID=A0ABD3PYG6_9STRA
MLAAGNDSNLSAPVFLLTAAITFAVYASTVSTSIAGGDAGELVAEGCTLGTSHPPGYPLYTIIVYFVTAMGKRWYRSLPPAYLVNIASCAFGSISSGFISLVVYMLTKNYGRVTTAKNQRNVLRCATALSAGLTCSFSPLMWQYNTTSEVFALHNLFVALIVYVLVIYSAKPNSNCVIAFGSFICGLALTNQHTSILLIIPVVGYVFYMSSMLFKPKLLLMSSLSFLVGMSFYSLLPILAIRRPHAGSWGDVTSMSGIIHHFLRRDYGTMRLYSGNDTASEGAITRCLSWAEDFISHQLCGLSLLFHSALGLICVLSQLLRRVPTALAMKKRERMKKGVNPLSEVWKTILFALIFYLFVFHSLSNLPLSNPLLYGIHQRFWMHPNILMFMLIGIGGQKLILSASNGSPSQLLAFTSMVLSLPFVAYQKNFSISDQSANNHFRNYAMAVLSPLPSNSLLLINYDQQWTSVRYLQECEGIRNDITSINLSMMTFEWWESKRKLYTGVSFPGTHYTKGNTLPWKNGGFAFSEFVDANVGRFGTNIFVGGRLNFEDPQYNEKYEEQPFGLVRRIQTRERTSASAESYRSESLKAWRIIASHLSSDLPCEKNYPLSTWENTIRREFFDHLVSRSTFLLDIALTEKQNSTGMPHRTLPSIAEAAAWLELAQSWDKDTYARQSSMKKNLGLAYMNIVRSKDTGNFPIIENIFGDSNQHRRNWWTGASDDNWKEWATHLWKAEWETFLSLESSKAEPGYMQIKNIYESVMNSSRAKSNLR